MNKRIIIVGAGASGKDYLKKKFKDRGFAGAVSCTSRPIRKNEVNGKDYFFISEEEFKKDIEKDSFYEWITFNGWYYGTPRILMEASSMVFIMTPSGIAKLKEEDRKESFIIYLDIDENIRRIRLSERGDADTVDRRILADIEDFKDFKDYDIKIDTVHF